MRNLSIFIFSLILFAACSSGQKSLQRGDYYQAINQAVERLQSDPGNSKSIQVLADGYPLAIKYYQEEIDASLSSNDPLKWSKTLEIMETVNKLSDVIRRTPAARKVVSNPKTYYEELTSVKEKAAAEAYDAGMKLLANPTRESARQAYNYFVQVDKLVPSYQKVNEMLAKAKDLGTYKVIIEQVPVFTEKYSLVADFFYDQVIAMLRYNFPDKGFVNFYSPSEAGNYGIKQPDMILKMNFYDFSIGNLTHSESEEPLSKTVQEKVKVPGNDPTLYEVKNRQYKGTIKVIKDEVMSQAVLTLTIIDFKANQVLLKEQLPGQFIWSNAYGIYVGDKEALEQRHQDILKNKAYPAPAAQDLFVAVTKPIYNQLSYKVQSFFRRYNN